MLRRRAPPSLSEPGLLLEKPVGWGLPLVSSSAVFSGSVTAGDCRADAAKHALLVLVLVLVFVLVRVLVLVLVRVRVRGRLATCTSW